MYRVIYLSIAYDDPFDQHNFNIISDTFETIEDAKRFIVDNLIEEDKSDFIDDDDELREITNFEVSEYDDEVDYEVYTGGDLIYRHEYKIVE